MPAADGDILIATFTDAGFAGIATVLGHPEWPADPRFDSPAQRVANRGVLESLPAEARARVRSRVMDRLAREQITELDMEALVAITRRPAGE